MEKNRNFFYAERTSLLYLASHFCIILTFSSANAMDMVQIFNIAEKRDPIYSKAQNDAKSIASLVPQARVKLFLPHVGLSGSKKQIGQDIQLNEAFGAGGKTNFVSTQYRINLKQPIYHHDRIINLSQAKKRFKKAQLSVIAAHQELIFRVAEKYFNLLSASDELYFAQSEAASLEGQLERAQQRFDVGLIAITDVQEAEAGYDRARAQEIRAINRIENAMGSLREITGEYHRNISSLGSDLPLVTPEPPDIERWTDKALGGNLELKQARIETEVQKKEISKARSRYLPTIDIVGGHSFNKQGGRFGSSETDSTDIGLEVSIPLFLGGEVFFKSREEKFKYVASLNEIERIQRKVEKDVRDAYLGVINQVSLVNAYGKAVTSARSSLESTRAGFKVGNRTTIDIVDAESILSQAKRDYSRARYEYIIETLKLKQATGSLGMTDINYVNGWLSDQKNNAILSSPRAELNSPN